MSQPELIHFGEQCAPGIIINDILGQKRKNLFQMGFYSFNGILAYLTQNQLETIYQPDLLVNASNQPLAGIKSVVSKYGHSGQTVARHRQYGFGYNHDFIVENNTITNHNFAVALYQEKIRNFLADLASPAPKVFITFTQNVTPLSITPMVELLRARLSSCRFVLLIFTPGNEPSPVAPPEVEIIRLERQFDKWWEINMPQREPLYRSIYTKFHSAMTKHGLTVPPFEQTPYFRSIH